MPLSALIDGQLLCAALLDDKQWFAVKGKEVLLQPCGHRGFGRVSPLGTRHFVHERDSGCEHSESAEHMHLKAVIVRAAAGCGWDAATEVRGEGFVADVLAVRDRQRVALEVQRSKQVLRDYRYRQDRYREQGIRCVWFAKSTPAGHRGDPGLPLFVVRDWETSPNAIVMGRARPVHDVVTALLTGQLRWQPSVMANRVTNEVMRLVCPVCGTRREVVVSRWRQGTCTMCGLPVLNQETNPGWWEHGRCCGYWGPALTVSRASQGQLSESLVDLGHWCLVAPPATTQRVSA